MRVKYPAIDSINAQYKNSPSIYASHIREPEKVCAPHHHMFTFHQLFSFAPLGRLDKEAGSNRDYGRSESERAVYIEKHIGYGTCERKEMMRAPRG